MPNGWNNTHTEVYKYIRNYGRDSCQRISSFLYGLVGITSGLAVDHGK